jgi:hypothetical protein
MRRRSYGATVVGLSSREIVAFGTAPHKSFGYRMRLVAGQGYGTSSGITALCSAMMATPSVAIPSRG